MDPQILTIIVAAISGGGLSQILRIAIDSWSTARGRRARTSQQLADWRECAYRARAWAIEHGATDDDIGTKPTW